MIDIGPIKGTKKYRAHRIEYNDGGATIYFYDDYVRSFFSEYTKSGVSITALSKAEYYMKRLI